MSDIAIKVEGLSKLYKIGKLQRRHDTLRDRIADARVFNLFKRRNGDGSSPADLRSLTSDLRSPTSDSDSASSDSRLPTPDSETLWALKDVSFEVKRGEVVGIIGRNGAGKSTLLKILSRITEPTEGYADINGRVASLLEVGTGFHPELTGRENIYLNGSILGMKRAEINNKFDEIVAFAEIERFIDTPVKHYSSGMYVRLAFAVAAHLEPEILLVDEVLAVGDAAFQKKCLGKMGDVAREGRTVLFVSHNMGAIQQLCQKAVLLEAGHMHSYSQTGEAVRLYMRSIRNHTGFDPRLFMGTLTPILNFTELTVNDSGVIGELTLRPSSSIRIKVLGECKQDVPFFRTTFSVFRDGARLFTLHDVITPELLPRGRFQSTVEIPPLFLRPGDYSVAVGGYRDGMNEWIWGADLLTFTVAEEWGHNFDPINIGLVNLPHTGSRKLI